MHPKWLVPCVLLLVAPALNAQQRVRVECLDNLPHYTTVLSGLTEEVIETEQVRIATMDLGTPMVGTNAFSAVVTNKTDRQLMLGLDLRADPGFYLRKAQDQSAHAIEPRETREIRAHYRFRHMTDEAWVRVRFGAAEMEAGRVLVVNPFYERHFQVGCGNPAVDYAFERFERVESPHFDIFVYRYLSPSDVSDVTSEREAAYQRIAEILSVEYPQKVRLFLFPDSAAKTGETGHIGMGWATGSTIVEIYNENTRLDPYHELTHIVASQLGYPPALFREGLALYLAERFGSDALEYLGGPGRTVDLVSRQNAERGRLLPMNSLFAFTGIGGAGTRPAIAYPQAASFVKYLIEEHGIDRFRTVYSTLTSTTDSMAISANADAFRDTYGASVDAMASDWIAYLARTVVDVPSGLRNESNDGPHVYWESESTAFVFHLCDDSLVVRRIDVEQALRFNGLCSDSVVEYVMYARAPVIEPHVFEAVPRVFAVSDVHGEHETLVDLLRNAHVIDDAMRWSWGDGHLVILGDVLDRGDRVTECLWLIHRLEREARLHGGRVHYLLGNHEVMVLHGNLRYVNEKYRQGIVRRAEIWYDDFIGPDMELGRWLRTKHTAVRLNEVLFVHGGVSPTLTATGMGLSELNNTVRTSLDLRSYELAVEETARLLFGDDGPFWYRGYLRDPRVTPDELAAILSAFDVQAVVVGHTEVGEIQSRFDGQVIGIDVPVDDLGGLQGLLWEDGAFWRVTVSGERQLIR